MLEVGKIKTCGVILVSYRVKEMSPFVGHEVAVVLR